MKYNIHHQLVQTSRLESVDFNNIPFGRTFSDHVFVADYVNGEWTNLAVVPYEKMLISPANLSFHYGQAIFEGMKIFKNIQGQAVIFRGDMHIRRLNASAVRMAMPTLPAAIFEQGLEALIRVDHRWIPEGEDSSLYIRPVMFAADEFIGVRPSETYKFVILTSPVGPYYANPVKLTSMPDFIRAAKGGIGAAKTAGNYAASLLPTELAKAQGYDQIMWLDAKEARYVQEAGTMNLFFVIGETVVTPSLADGTILAGITRDTFLKILKYKGLQAEERDLSVDELVESFQKGRLTEAFGAGTAAVVAPVSVIRHGETVMQLPELTESQSVGALLKETLVNIRKGKIEDVFGWIKTINIEA